MKLGYRLSLFRRLILPRYPSARYCTTIKPHEIDPDPGPQLSDASDPKAAPVKKCFGYCHGQSYDMQQLRKYFSTPGIKYENEQSSETAKYTIERLPSDIENVLLVSYADNSVKSGLMFYFCTYGTCVHWNIPKEVEEEIADEQLWNRAVVKKYDEKTAEREDDFYDYIEDQEAPTSFSKGTRKNKTICLNTSGSEERQILEKLAFSYALAQSVRLGVIENDVDKFLKTLNKFPDHLNIRSNYSLRAIRAFSTGDVEFGRSLRDLRKIAAEKIGGLYQHRFEYLIRLDLRDEPNFFWDREDIAKFCTIIRHDLDIVKRLDNLKTKIEFGVELAQSLYDIVCGHYSDRLEWIIILLIAVECVQSFTMIYFSYGN